MKVYCIVVHWQGYKHTLNCVDSLIRDNYLQKEIVVVDNSSSEKIGEMLSKRHPSVKVLESDENKGFSGGNNIGIEYALKNNAGAVFLVNSDVVVPDGVIEELADQSERIGDSILGPVITGETGTEFVESAGMSINTLTGRVKHRHYRDKFRELNYKTRKVDALSGTALFINSEVFERIGLLKEEYFLYMEDVEFCLRASENEISVKNVGTVKINHIGQASIKKLDQTLSVYYSLRNHLYLMKERSSMPFPLSTFRSVMIILYYVFYLLFRSSLPAKAGLKRIYEGVRDYLKCRKGQIPERTGV